MSLTSRITGAALACAIAFTAPAFAQQSRNADIAVTFASGSADLDAAARSALAAFVRANGNGCQAVLTGHTDTVGSAAANQALAERRVRSVAAYMASLGYQGEITGTRAAGESQLAVNQEGDVLANRRVEVRSGCAVAGFNPAWIAAGIPLICLFGNCDSNDGSSTTTTTTTTGN